MKSLFRRQVMYPDHRQGKHYRSQDAVDETQRGGDYTELIGAKGSGLAFIAHGNDYARTSLRKGSIECPAKDFGGSRSRFAATEAEAQSRISRYISRPAMLPNQRELVSDAITTTFGTSQGPRHPQIESWSRLSRPRLRHSAFNHSAGTSGRPRSTAPQQQPWHTSTCPITSRFVVRDFPSAIDLIPEYTIPEYSNYMAHISNDGGKKLLTRVRRIRGQIEGIERAIQEGTDCYAVLQQTAAARGALGGLMAELIDGHVRHHVSSPTEREKATNELMQIVRSYLR
jgi:DNA-binding FrmR family transcriptional regulator